LVNGFIDESTRFGSLIVLGPSTARPQNRPAEKRPISGGAD